MSVSVPWNLSLTASLPSGIRKQRMTENRIDTDYRLSLTALVYSFILENMCYAVSLQCKVADFHLYPTFSWRKR